MFEEFRADESAWHLWCTLLWRTLCPCEHGCRMGVLLQFTPSLVAGRFDLDAPPCSQLACTLTPLASGRSPSLPQRPDDVMDAVVKIYCNHTEPNYSL